MKHLEINEFTADIAKDAVRDILYMYWDMAQSGAFGHNTETGRFNQYLCLRASRGSDGYGSDEDVELLQRGSAVKLLCFLSDHIHERGGPPKASEFLGQRIGELLKSGELDHLPSAKRALEQGLAGNATQFNSQLDVVYSE